MNSDPPRISLEQASPRAKIRPVEKSFRSFWIALLFLIVGVGAGYSVSSYLEFQRDYKSHVSRMTPLLRYEERVQLGRKRGSNETMRIVSYHLFLAREEGLDLDRFLDSAQPPEVIPPSLAALNKERFLSNLTLGDRFGLFTTDNLARLAKGEAPYVTRGEFAGQQAQVEHIIPVAVAPAMDNLLCNLEWLPESLNASKSDSITERAYQIAIRFHESGILSSSEFLKVKRAFEADK